MKRILAIVLAAMFLFSFGFVTEASADHKETTGTRYKQYLGKQDKIIKLQTNLANTTDPAKAAKLQTRIDKQTIKMNNIKPVVRGLGAYQRDTAKLDKLNAKIQAGGLSDKQTAKINKQVSALGVKIPKDENKAIANESKQRDKIQAKAVKLGNKLEAGGLTQKQETKIQNKIDYLGGKATWLRNKATSILLGN